MRLDVILIVHDIPTVANDVIEVNVFPPPPRKLMYSPQKYGLTGPSILLTGGVHAPVSR